MLQIVYDLPHHDGEILEHRQTGLIFWGLTVGVYLYKYQISTENSALTRYVKVMDIFYCVVHYIKMFNKKVTDMVLI